MKKILTIFALFSTLFLFGGSRETGCVGSQTVKTSHTEPPCGDFYYMETQEIWKDVVGYEGYYKVSNLGNVKSVDREFYHPTNKSITRLIGKVKKTTINHLGYEGVTLSVEAVRKYFGIHQLVAQAFIPNPENKLTVNHKNGIKTDNRVCNLEWYTQQEQVIHCYNVLGLKRPTGENNVGSKLVYLYNLSGSLIKTHKGAADLCRILGINPSSAVGCLRGKQKTANGYVWSYRELPIEHFDSILIRKPRI